MVGPSSQTIFADAPPIAFEMSAASTLNATSPSVSREALRLRPVQPKSESKKALSKCPWWSVKYWVSFAKRRYRVVDATYHAIAIFDLMDAGSCFGSLTLNVMLSGVETIDALISDVAGL